MSLPKKAHAKVQRRKDSRVNLRHPHLCAPFFSEVTYMIRLWHFLNGYG